MIVGDIELRGRLLGPGRLGSFAAGACVSVKLKSVSSLLSRNPRPGTTIALPPVCSIVSVYSTTLPHLSDTVRLVVWVPWVLAWPAGAVAQPAASSGAGATGLGSARVGLIWQARAAANESLSSR